MLILLAIYVVSATLITSMLYANLQSYYPTMANAYARRDLGFAWSYGIILGFVGPFGVLLVLLLSGFAEDGFLNPFKFNRNTKE
jgi:hypothetical protein